MATIAEVERDFVEQLSSIYNEQETKSLVWLVINHLLKINKTQFFIQKQKMLSKEDVTRIYQILDELKESKPLQYILAETEFYGLSFIVNPSVLIPRPETEELVEWVLKTVKQPIFSNSLQIIDIGTGSGCIAIALKENLPHASIFAIDISSSALAIATKNASLNGVEVKFMEDDILNPQTEIQYTKFDFIISNPPYVRRSEKSQMHTNVINYEPHLALFVPDEDALIFYKHIIDFALTHLNNLGFLFFEINEFLGQKIVELLSQNGFTDIELKKDIRGKDRMIKAIYKK